MAGLALVIGNKNYSSWSLRPYLALKHAGATFEEILVRLDQPDYKEQIEKYSPSGKVPALLHDGLVVSDSLAIVEYVAELFPKAKLWPEDRAARARARSVSAEMHSGFAALRRDLPMDLRARVKRTWSEAAEADIQRILRVWRECLETRTGEGPFLFGAFSIADCMYAPVVGRFFTYEVPVDGSARAYMDAVWAVPAMQAWLEEAAREPYTIPT